MAFTVSDFNVQEQMLQQLGRLADDVAYVQQYFLEQQYRTHAHAYFGTRFRNLRVIEPSSLDKVEEAYTAGQFTSREWRGLNKLDVLMRGTAGVGADKHEELLALEVSWIIDARDVERADERARRRAS
jgi:hypothetical protein